MSNHTQEPWTLIESSRLDQPNRIVSENGMPVATLYAPQKADARLISAAPELLAAIKDMTDAFGHYCEGDPSDDEVAALNRAMGAIKKATGVRA
jgi:hypothetical protein